MENTTHTEHYSAEELVQHTERGLVHVYSVEDLGEVAKVWFDGGLWQISLAIGPGEDVRKTRHMFYAADAVANAHAEELA